MKIKNSKLELERVNSLFDLPNIIKRKDLRYRSIFAISPSRFKIPCCSCSFKGLLEDPTSKAIMDTFGEYYIITTSGVKSPKINYTLSEKRILVSMVSGLADDHRLDTAEIFCHAVGNRELLDMFYSDYGTMDKIRELCLKLYETNNIQTMSDTTKLYPYQYQRPRYSIYDLVQDLVESKAFICTDPELTSGKYKKISRNLKRKASSEIVEDDWNPIIGKSFNKTRANLSINYLAHVKVEIPENTFGVNPGERLLKTSRSICLVKDGKVCNTSFGIRIKDGSLVKKLKAAGVIKLELLYPGDYLVNISNIPVISKSKTSGLSSFDLGTAETWYRLSDVAIEYLRRREYKERRKLVSIPDKINFMTDGMSESEKYLSSLGIYGDYFHSSKEVGKIKNIYNAEELVSSFKILPTKETCTKNITKILNGCSKVNSFISDFINKYVKPDIDKGTSYKTLIESWENKKKYYADQIRDYKFRLISGKSLLVCVHGKRKSILNIRQIIKICDYEIPVSWSLKETRVIV